jgi:hypothetical protein
VVLTLGQFVLQCGILRAKIFHFAFMVFLRVGKISFCICKLLGE